MIGTVFWGKKIGPLDGMYWEKRGVEVSASSAI